MGRRGAAIKTIYALGQRGEKAKFTFAFSSFNAASIAARTEVEMVVAGEMERTVYGYGHVTTATTKEWARPTRTLEPSGRGGVGHKG